MIFVPFPRTIHPARSTWPASPSPLQDRSQNSRVYQRASLARGFQWEEEWPPLLGDAPMWGVERSATTRAFLTEIDRLAHRGDLGVLIRPWSHWEALGTLAAGTTATVAGAGQTGTTLSTAGWPAGTLKKGDYITVAGVPHALVLQADAAVDGGATLSVAPGISDGSEPANGATVTLNGTLRALIQDRPAFPEAHLIRAYAGLRIRFREALEP